MQTYELLVRNRAVRGNSEDMTLVRTSVGIDQAHILFDNREWLDFPITISFGQGADLVTQSLTVSEVADSTEWVAEATVLIPHEVIDMTGSIRVTLQGTDSEGRHIITAYGAPLSVEEAGDVVQGDVPEGAPTPDQWHQAYADAQVAINEVRGIINNLQAQLDDMVAAAQAGVDQSVADATRPATREDLGMVRVGDGLSVTEDGTLSSDRTNGITREQSNVIANVQLLATKAFDTTFDEDTGALETARLKSEAMPEDYDPGISADDIGDGLRLNDDGRLETYMGFTSSDQSIVATASVNGGARVYDLKHTSEPTGDTAAGQASDAAASPGGYVFVPHVERNASGHVTNLKNAKVTLPGVNRGLSTNTEDGKTYVGHSSTSSMPATQSQHNYMTPGSTLPVTYAASVDDYGHLMGGYQFMLHVPSLGDGLSDSVGEDGSHTISVDVEYLREQLGQ